MKVKFTEQVTDFIDKMSLISKSSYTMSNVRKHDFLKAEIVVRQIIKQQIRMLEISMLRSFMKMSLNVQKACTHMWERAPCKIKKQT